MFNNSKKEFVFKPITMPKDGFNFTSESTPIKFPMDIDNVILVDPHKKFIDDVLKLSKTNAKLVNWKFISEMTLSESQLEAFKENLVWSSVSKRISIRLAIKYRDYIDWTVFERYISAYVKSQLHEKLDQVEDGVQPRDLVINLESYFD